MFMETSPRARAKKQTHARSHMCEREDKKKNNVPKDWAVS